MDDFQHLWNLAEKTRRRPIGPNQRAFLWTYARSRIERAFEGGDPQDLQRVAERLAQMADGMETAVLADLQGEARVIEVTDPGAQTAGAADGRWGLWADLRSALASPKGKAAWSPLRVNLAIDQSVGLLGSSRVEVSFDSRLSLSRLRAGLAELWPELVERQWVRQARPMRRRAESLVRLVCLECSPALTWEQRWKLWQRECAPGGRFVGKKWEYADHRALHSDFRRAEIALTGRPRGLAVFYDARLREALRAYQDVSNDEIARKAEAGDPLALAILKDVRGPAMQSLAPLHQALYEAMLRELARMVQAGELTFEAFSAKSPEFNTQERWEELMAMNPAPLPGAPLGNPRIEGGPQDGSGLLAASTEELWEGFFRYAGIGRTPGESNGEEGQQ
jgi:hypothetical protein